MSLFGQNSASALIVVSASSSNYGKIIHTNEEVESFLGYKRKELLEKNVSMIMPAIIAINHNRFVSRYLETGRRRIIDKQC